MAQHETVLQAIVDAIMMIVPNGVVEMIDQDGDTMSIVISGLMAEGVGIEEGALLRSVLRTKAGVFAEQAVKTGRGTTVESLARKYVRDLLREGRGSVLLRA